MNGFSLRPEWYGGKVIAVVLTACLIQMTALIPTAQSETKEKKINYLKSLSIEELLQTEVTSVSKKAEHLFDTAAAVFVITQEDIIRSGARSIPEALRMVPGLQVAHIDANKWVITSRGFADRFSNKLLVLMDGRSVYTPLFSGVYWDVQDTLLEDIDRIEVIRGPGATLWGANAVNGVVNIITKSARNTQGGLLSTGVGSHETALDGARFGGQIGDETYYRIFAKGFRRSDFENPDGGSANDKWRAARGGFRLETKPGDRDELTFQGDLYQNKAKQTATVDSYLVPPFSRTMEDDIDAYGLNLIGRWKKQTSDTSNFMFQLYYDRTSREEILLNEVRDTFDLEFQHQWKLFNRHDVIWGVGYRYTTDETEGEFNNLLDPEDRSDQLFSAFAQDDIMLVADHLWVTVGSKFEHNDYTGFEVQPSARMRWKPTTDYTVWAAVSRAVRTPSRSDHDLQANHDAFMNPFPPMPGVVRLQGNDDVESEELTAFEAGLRWSPDPVFSMDLTAFYNTYDNFRSIERSTPFVEAFPLPPHMVIPALLDNKIDAHTYGFEAFLSWKPFDIWQLSAGYSFLDVSIDPESDSLDTLSKDYERFSPDYQVQLRSYLDLPYDLSLDTMLYLVDEVPHWDVSDYARLDLRLGWDPSEDWSFSLTAMNVLNSEHAEFGDPSGINESEVPRSIFGKITWRF